jgi:hypothetical protein
MHNICYKRTAVDAGIHYDFDPVAKECLKIGEATVKVVIADVASPNVVKYIGTSSLTITWPKTSVGTELCVNVQDGAKSDFDKVTLKCGTEFIFASSGYNFDFSTSGLDKIYDGVADLYTHTYYQF